VAACASVVVCSAFAGIALGAYVSLRNDAWFAPRTSNIAASDEAWMESVRSGAYFRNQSPAGAGPPASPKRPVSRRYFRAPLSRPAPAPEPEESGETYRTMCVRLCDGYAWPISFATTRGNFSRDEEACKASCSSPAKLYSYRNPGEEIEDMVDTSGKRYSTLPTAYFYQAIYDESCKCRPHPWEKESLQRHRIYALEARARKGDKKARAELRDLKPQSAKEPRRRKRKSRRRR